MGFTLGDVLKAFPLADTVGETVNGARCSACEPWPQRTFTGIDVLETRRVGLVNLIHAVPEWDSENRGIEIRIRGDRVSGC